MARAATPPRIDARSSEAAFDAWFSQHADELRSFSTRLTGDPSVAEEVVQETFARAWLHVDALRTREQVGPWLYRVARNLCMDHHRLRKRQVPSALMGDAAVDRSTGAHDQGDPVRHVVREEEREVVRAALSGLTDRHRDVLYLRDIQGLAYEELGARHGLSEASARAVIARARRRLRDEIKTMGQGVFGAAAAVRLRVDGLFRRVGGDRAPVEPLAAAVTHYVVAAAAVVSMAFGPPAATTPGGGEPVSLRGAGGPSTVARVSGDALLSASTSAEGAAALDPPDAPADVEKVIVVETHHDAIPENPYADSDWLWLDVYWKESDESLKGMNEVKQAYDVAAEEYDDECSSSGLCPREDEELARL